MPTFRPRKPTLSRGRSAGPEHNLIQHPELVKNLAGFLGMRQQHIAPALSEGLQPVIIVGDISQRSPANRPLYTWGRRCPAPGGVLSPRIFLHNQAGSGIRARVKGMQITGITGSGGVQTINIWYRAVDAFVLALPLDNPTGMDPAKVPSGSNTVVGRIGGIVGTPATSWAREYYVSDGMTIDATLPKDGWVIEPGFCLDLSSDIPTTGVFSANFAWDEEPIA